MKILALSLCLGVSAFGQNYSVTFSRDVPELAYQVALGMPTNWPVPTLTRPIGTNTSVTPPAVLMTEQQFLSAVAAARPGMEAYRAARDAERRQKQLDRIEIIRQRFALVDSNRWGTNTPTALEVSRQVDRLARLLVEFSDELIELRQRKIEADTE